MVEKMNKDGTWETIIPSERYFTNSDICYEDDYQRQIYRIMTELERTRRLNKLLSLYIESTIIRYVDDTIARKEIITFITKEKENGEKSVNIIDIIEKFRFPPEQIYRVMESLKKHGIKERSDEY